MSSVSSWAAPCLRLVRDTEDRLRGLETFTTHFLSRRFPRIESAVALQPTDARTKASIAIRCRHASAPPFCRDPCSDLCSTRARFTLADQMTFCACVHQALIDGYHSLHVCLTHWKKRISWRVSLPSHRLSLFCFLSSRVVLQPAGRDLHHIAKVWRGAKPKYNFLLKVGSLCWWRCAMRMCNLLSERRVREREGKYILRHVADLLHSLFTDTSFTSTLFTSIVYWFLYEYTDVLAFYWYICYFNINYFTFARCPGRLYEMRE